jgi:hypothetical protein
MGCRLVTETAKADRRFHAAVFMLSNRLPSFPLRRARRRSKLEIARNIFGGVMSNHFCIVA